MKRTLILIILFFSVIIPFSAKADQGTSFFSYPFVAIAESVKNHEYKISLEPTFELKTNGGKSTSFKIKPEFDLKSKSTFRQDRDELDYMVYYDFKREITKSDSDNIDKRTSKAGIGFKYIFNVLKEKEKGIEPYISLAPISWVRIRSNNVNKNDEYLALTYGIGFNLATPVESLKFSFGYEHANEWRASNAKTVDDIIVGLKYEFKDKF